MLQVQVMQTRKTVPGPEHPHTWPAWTTWHFLFSKRKTFELDSLRQYTSSETITDDVDRYFDTPSVVFQLYTGWVLQWWQTKQAEYPCIARATRDYFPIQASEVDTCMERTSSDGRDILGIRRWSMKGNTFRVEITWKSKQRGERSDNDV
jgi:hypothetical protein